MTNVLEVSNVSKRFGKEYALRDISFAVHKGETVGFVGANGAGKTTTISTILGFITPTDGEVKVFGDVVKTYSAHLLHYRIGYAAGDMEMPPRLTGEQFLRFVLRQSRGNHDKRLADLVQRFKPQLDKPIKTLSRGSKQKIALIAAFMTDPDLIVLDEPTSGLDPVMQEVFLDLVREAQASGKTVFMSSHYLAEVADVCSRVLLMRNGKLIRDLSAKEMQASSGKHVRIVTEHLTTKPPLGADDVEIEKSDSMLTMKFVYRGKLDTLQVWIAALKRLQDIEVGEHSLEGVFKSLYEDEVAAV